MTGKGKGSCATAEELDAWLNGCGLDTSTWGKTKEKTKTVSDLWAELQSGETFRQRCWSAAMGACKGGCASSSW